MDRLVFDLFISIRFEIDPKCNSNFTFLSVGMFQNAFSANNHFSFPVDRKLQRWTLLSAGELLWIVILIHILRSFQPQFAWKCGFGFILPTSRISSSSSFFDSSVRFLFGLAWLNNTYKLHFTSFTFGYFWIISRLDRITLHTHHYVCDSQYIVCAHMYVWLYWLKVGHENLTLSGATHPHTHIHPHITDIVSRKIKIDWN